MTPTAPATPNAKSILPFRNEKIITENVGTEMCPRGKNGFVYFIEAIGADAIKIGWALKPERRLRDLAIGCPLELKLLAAAPASLGHEGRLQTIFAAHGIRGEWFRRNDDLTAVIEVVLKTGALPAHVRPVDYSPFSERPGIIPFIRCIDAIGSQAEVARFTDTTQANISSKVRSAKRIPAEWALKLEAETLRRGKPVWCDELRPDIYPPDDSTCMHPIRRHQLFPQLYPDPGAA
jgi:DNA-binding transcriptional regulator YdaS (Cro superfamily)